MIYSNRSEYKPKDVIEAFFMLFLFDISAKAEELESEMEDSLW